MGWFKTNKVLVVGSEGFIGSHLTKTDVHDLDAPFDLKTGQDFLNWVDVLSEYKAIVFLAADMRMTSTAYTYNESLYRALDIYMRHFPLTHIIYTSSAAVYPDSVLPSSEKTLVAPSNFYGKGKLLGEVYVQQYRNHTILRLSNVYSQGDGRSVVDKFIRGGRTIFGDGTAVRDYVYVGVVVEAILDAIERPVVWRGITNVSSAKPRSVNELWQKFGTGEPIRKKPRKSDVGYSLLDNTKMLLLLATND